MAWEGDGDGDSRPHDHTDFVASCMRRSECSWSEADAREFRRDVQGTFGRSPLRVRLRVKRGVPMAGWGRVGADGDAVALLAEDVYGIFRKGQAGVPSPDMRSALVYLLTGDIGLARMAARNLAGKAWCPWSGDKVPPRLPVLLTYERHTVLAYQRERGGPVWLLDPWPFCLGDADNRCMMRRLVWEVRGLFRVACSDEVWHRAATLADEDVATEEEEEEGVLTFRRRLGGPVRHVCPQLQSRAGNSCTMFSFAWMIDTAWRGPEAADRIVRGSVSFDESAMRRHTWSILRGGVAEPYPSAGLEGIRARPDDTHTSHTLVRAPLGANGKPLRRCCQLCSSGRGNQTKKLTYKCGACDLFLCHATRDDGRGPCFAIYHAERGLPFDLGRTPR